MEFTTFVQLLHPVIGAGNSTHAFTRSIFDAIVTEDGQAVIDEYTESSYKAYFNGSLGITRLARKICAYLEPEEFVDYIDQFSDAVIQSLCDSFQGYLPSITLHNAGEELSKLFAGIIKEAAVGKKKNTRDNDVRSSHDVLSEKILASGKAVADAWDKAIKHLADESEYVEAEVLDEADSPDTNEKNAQADTRIQVINNPTIVNQYGAKNIHIEHVDTLNL